ncbi:MAG: 2-phosphosulfolactate phosphatase [Pirellulales bacterium]
MDRRAAIHDNARKPCKLSGFRVVQDVEEAKQAKRQSSSTHVKLCGERHCQPIEGFDLGNSPLEYSKETVSEKELIFSTTNGTQAVGATSNFSCSYLAGFVNRSAVAAAILSSKIKHWTVVCAGTDGEVAGEDVLAAGAIAQILLGQPNVKVHLANDSARLAIDLWLDAWSSKLALAELLETFCGGYNLVRAGYSDDIRFAAQVDIIHCVPSRQAGGIFVALA